MGCFLYEATTCFFCSAGIHFPLFLMMANDTSLRLLSGLFKIFNIANGAICVYNEPG